MFKNRSVPSRPILGIKYTVFFLILVFYTSFNFWHIGRFISSILVLHYPTPPNPPPPPPPGQPCCLENQENVSIIKKSQSSSGNLTAQKSLKCLKLDTLHTDVIYYL